MKKTIRKIARLLLWTATGIVLFVMIIVVTMPLWVGTVARPILNAVAPRITKTAFRIERLSLNPFTGRLEVGGFLLGNPDGYSDPRAVECGQFVVDVNILSLFGKVIEVEEVSVRDCFVSYSVGGTNGVDNVKQILANVTGKAPGEGDADDRANSLREADASDDSESAAKKASEEAVGNMAKEADDDGRRVVIDRVAIEGLQVKLQMFTLPALSLTLKDIGKSSGGVSIGDAAGIVWDSVLNGSSNIGDGAKKAADAINDGAKKATDAVRGLLQF